MQNFNFKELLEFKPEQGIITLKENKMMLFQDIAMDYLKDELIRSLGMDLARGTLTRFGYRCGFHDAKIIKNTCGEEIGFISLGLTMYRWRGIGNVSIDGELEFSRDARHYLLKGRWENSREAVYYVERYGTGKHPVCWISTGYASGFASGFTGLNIICDEFECVGKGDDCCRWEMRSVESWGGRAVQNRRYYEINFSFKNLQTMLAEEKSIDIHRRLTQLVLEGHGVDVIAGTLGEIIRCPVIILGKNLDVIAESDNYSIDPKEIMSLKNFLRDNLWQGTQLKPGTKSKHLFRKGSGHAFWSFPIVAGAKFWGYIIVHETSELTELEMVAIEHACTVCAMDKLKQDAAIEIELRLRGDLLDDILSVDKGREINLMNKAFQLGCDLSRPHRVMVVDLIGGSRKKNSGFSPELAVDIVKSGISSLVEKMVLDSLVAVRRNRIVIILCTEGEGGHNGIARLIQEWVSANIPDCSVNVTWGRECLELADYRLSFEQAWQASDILKNLGRKDECSGFDDLGIYTILWDSKNGERMREFAILKLGCLLEYDSKYKSNLLKTLEIFLQKNCNLRETAAAAFIHINTLKYRLNKIKQLTGLNLSNDEDRFQCQLSLRLLKALKSY